MLTCKWLLVHTSLVQFSSCLSCSSLVAKQRKLDIAESKFLGGNMAHTRMVKGLDYALLQKVPSVPPPPLSPFLMLQVRSKITLKDREEEELRLLERRRREKEKASGAAAAASKEHGSSKGTVTFRTRMGLWEILGPLNELRMYFLSLVIPFPAKNIYRAVFENKPPTRNEFFLPGRMVCQHVVLSPRPLFHFTSSFVRHIYIQH